MTIPRRHLLQKRSGVGVEAAHERLREVLRRAGEIAPRALQLRRLIGAERDELRLSVELGQAVRFLLLDKLELLHGLAGVRARVPELLEPRSDCRTERRWRHPVDAQIGRRHDPAVGGRGDGRHLCHIRFRSR